MKILATKCIGKELRPGDLFSTVGPEYWDHHNKTSVGERVYIRTQCPADSFEDQDATVYRIQILPEMTVEEQIEHILEHQPDRKFVTNFFQRNPGCYYDLCHDLEIEPRYEPGALMRDLREILGNSKMWHHITKQGCTDRGEIDEVLRAIIKRFRD